MQESYPETCFSVLFGSIIILFEEASEVCYLIHLVPLLYQDFRAAVNG